MPGMKLRRGMKRGKKLPGSKSKRLGAVKRPGERKFIVSISSSEGGGRQEVFARTPELARDRALINKFYKVKKGVDTKKFRDSLSVIVTDTTKKKDAQTFF